MAARLVVVGEAGDGECVQGDGGACPGRGWRGVDRLGLDQALRPGLWLHGLHPVQRHPLLGDLRQEAADIGREAGGKEEVAGEQGEVAHGEGAGLEGLG